MKSSYIAAFALLTTSFTPISMMTAPAQAGVPAYSDKFSFADMQGVCDTLDSDGAGTNYQVVLTEGATVYGTPTGDSSTIVNDESTRVANHSSLSTPYGTVSFFGNAGKHGGSVNLFATTGYPGITYAGSLVDQNWQRFQTDTYNFSCQVQHWEVVGSHEEGVPGTPAEGYYTNNGTGPSEGQGSCQGLSPANPFWGQDIGNCIWHQTAPGTEDTTVTVDDYGFVNSGAAVPETLTDGPNYVDTVLYAAGVSQAVPVTEFDAAPYFAGDAVVCINPGKKGGTWTAKAGWTKTAQCSTSYFTTAPYISGANVFSGWSSLPAL